MGPVKQVRLAALCLIAAAVVLLSEGSAFGDKWRLVPPADSPEPDASGVVTVTFRHVRWISDGGIYEYYQASVFLECQGLAPNSIYSFWTDRLQRAYVTTDATGWIATGVFKGPVSTKDELRPYVLEDSLGQVVLASK
jgi:hypothetical protein